MKQKKRGLLLHADDLEVGSLVTIHHWKDGTPDWLGVPLVIRSVNLPFVAVKVLPDDSFPPIPLDLRRCVLMPVKPEFVEALRRSPAE